MNGEGPGELQWNLESQGRRMPQIDAKFLEKSSNNRRCRLSEHLQLVKEGKVLGEI
jgi:hypothetical protein